MLVEVQDKGNYYSGGHLTRPDGYKETSLLPLTTTWKISTTEEKAAGQMLELTAKTRHIFPLAEQFVSNCLCCKKIWTV